MENKTQGTLYKETKDLDITQIAKMIRQELKTTFGKDFKFSVKTSRYSMGQSIDVYVSEAPLNYYNPLRVMNEYGDDPYLIEEGFEILRQIKKIVDQYNYDNSDTQIDYFDYKFAGSVEFDANLTNKWVLEIKGAN